MGERESSTVAFYGSKLPFSLALSTHTHIKRYTVHIQNTYVQYSYTLIYCVSTYIYSNVHMYNIAIHSYTVYIYSNVLQY